LQEPFKLELRISSGAKAQFFSGRFAAQLKLGPFKASSPLLILSQLGPVL
jgi:hypothetical protein